MSEYWTCPRHWKGETAFIVAGGPSVLKEDLSTLKGKGVIAINSSIFSVPWASYCMFADSRWYVQHRPLLEKMRSVDFISTSAVPFIGVHTMKKIKPPPGLVSETDSVVMEKTTLQAAINLACHLGANEIVVLGADMKRDALGRSHHHEPHRWPVRAGIYEEQIDQLRLTRDALIERGVRIWNTSMDSAIEFWPKRPLKDCIDGYEQNILRA